MKKFDIIKFVQDNSFPPAPGRHKHWRAGWTNISCPFCTGNPGYHLGFNRAQPENQPPFVCFRCGGHGLMNTIIRLLRCSEREAKNIIKRYSGIIVAQEQKEKRKRRVKEVSLPFGCGPLKETHKEYLRSRDFDPDNLERIWNLKGTGPIGSYKFRIIAPIYFKGDLVSYQGRDITGRTSLKYKACPQDFELRDHKHCLYGLGQVLGDTVVVNEGITDVWRLGPGAVGTFGVKYTKQQIILLARFLKIFLFFDSSNEDPEAIVQAEKLANALSLVGRDLELVDLDQGDPGALSQTEANEIMNDLLKDQRKLYK